MKNKIVFSFVTFLAAFQIYLFFLPFFVGLFGFGLLFAGVIIYGFFLVPREFKYFWLVKIFSYLVFGVALILGFKYILYGPIQSLFLLVLVTVFILVIDKISSYLYQVYSEKIKTLYIIVLILFLGVGIINTSDYAMSLKNPLYFPSLYYNQPDQLSKAIQAIKNDKDLYFSITSTDTVRLKPFLSDCGKLLSPVKSYLCYKASYFGLASAINDDRTTLVNKALKLDDKSGSVLSACELLPDTIYNDGKLVCYQNNMTNADQCTRYVEIGKALNQPGQLYNMDGCLSWLGQYRLHNISYCEQMSDSTYDHVYNRSLKDSCLSSQAIKKSDCMLITDIPSRDYCLKAMDIRDRRNK